MIQGAKFGKKVFTGVTQHYSGEAVMFTIKHPEQAAKNVVEYTGKAFDTVVGFFEAGAEQVSTAVVDGGASGAGILSEVAEESSGLSSEQILVACIASIGAVAGLYGGYRWWTSSTKQKDTMDRVADRSSPEAQSISRIVQKRTAAIRDPKVREALPDLLLATYNDEVQKVNRGFKD